MGHDPYDALSARWIRDLAKTPALRRAALQTLKRCPVNIRAFLRVPQARHIKAIALLTSAYSRLGVTEVASVLADELALRAVDSRGTLGWGYDFDVQTRWGYYRAGTRNAVATAFSMQALLDSARHPSLVEQARRYALVDLLRVMPAGSYFAYYETSTIPIHNASLLIAGAFARSAPEDQLATVGAIVEYSLQRQRSDGSWPYGESRGLEWVDGYHTAYNLDALAWWHARTRDAATREAIVRGLDLYLTRLIDPDGAARASMHRRFPVDIHACSTAVYVLSRLREYDERALPTATRVLSWTLRFMSRTDGRFAFQLHRHYRNSTSYIRWNDAHMLLALACYLEAVERDG